MVRITDRGTWPVVDIIVTTDYGSPQQAVVGGSPSPNVCANSVRIEMEIPNCGDAALQTSIVNGDLDGAFKEILLTKDYWPIPGSIDADHARGFAVLAAAFGKFDGLMPGQRNVSARATQAGKRK